MDILLINFVVRVTTSTFHFDSYEYANVSYKNAVRKKMLKKKNNFFAEWPVTAKQQKPPAGAIILLEFIQILIIYMREFWIVYKYAMKTSSVNHAWISRILLATLTATYSS